MLLRRLTMRVRSSWWMARLRIDAALSGGCVEIGPMVRLRVRVIFRGQGLLMVGKGATLGDAEAGLHHAPIQLAPRLPRARIAIGAGARLTNGIEMTALEAIEIGANCLVGPGARILDADFHGIGPDERHDAGRRGAVRIGDNVWIGVGAIILKGVGIGRDAVVGAGSVVVRSVPAGAVVLGNPAKVLLHVGVAEMV
jgi:carbonic anhydrase/acetyltransferase-like protein (isoleucine patch superfamily)